MLLVLEEAAQAPARLGTVAAPQLLGSAQAFVQMGALQQLLLMVLVGCALQQLLLVLEEAAQAPARLGTVAAPQLLGSAQASVQMGALQLLMLLMVLVGCALQLLSSCCYWCLREQRRLLRGLGQLWLHNCEREQWHRLLSSCWEPQLRLLNNDW